MSNILRSAAACVLVSSIGLAQAAPTAGWTTVDTHTYGTTVSFDSAGELAPNTVVTNQFAAQGVQMSGSIRANGCGYDIWNHYGMIGNSLGTYGPGCYTNDVDDVFSMKFDSTLSKLSFDAYSRDPLHIATLALYLKGSLVNSFSMADLGYSGLALGEGVQTDGRAFANTASDRAGILQIDGALFDEVRFSEHWAANQDGYLFFDNLRFDSASTQVPEPASLGLLGLGLAGIGVLRRKRQAANQA